MSQPFALQRLLEHAVDQTGQAAAALGDLNRQVQQHEEKLQLLFKYRDDYQERLRRAAGKGLDSAGLRNFYDFLERLEQAILQQHALVVNARTLAASGREEWQLRRRKSKAFDTLSQRFAVTVRHDEWSREQKAQDDFAGRASRKERPYG